MSTPLPIEAIKADLLNSLTATSQHNTIILSAPPGAGKSTRLPLWLVDLPQYQEQKIYLLQPRRLAAKNIAIYLASQLGEQVGETVGYRLRQEHKVSRKTRLEVITEGILVQLMQQDPELSACSLVIFDEFHERSVHADLAFAIARDIQQGLRDDLTILLMSATLDNQTLAEQLPEAKILQSEGRSFPVELSYLPPPSSLDWRQHALNVIKNQLAEHTGSILVFLPGSYDIQWLANQLEDQLPAHWLLCPLYGELALAAQQAAIAPAERGGQKLVLATNIAETSLTIEGIDLVIDAGLEKVAIFEPATLTNRLSQQAIAKASAIQRAGRAGRLAPGRCLRLYSSEDFERRQQQSEIDIKRTDLLPVLIEAARWGVNQLKDLPLLALPAVKDEQQAWRALATLGITEQRGKLTELGQLSANLSCHPRFALMIHRSKVVAERENAGDHAGVNGKDLQNTKLPLLACLVAALLEERDIYRQQQARSDCNIEHRLHDLIHRKNTFGHLAERILRQAQQLASQAGLGANVRFNRELDLPFELTGCLLVLAYPERLSKNRRTERLGDSHFLSTQGKGLALNTDDVLASEPWLAVAQIYYQQNQHRQSQQQNKLTIALAAKVDINLLSQWQVIEPELVDCVAYQAQQQKIVAVVQDRLGSIVLSEQNAQHQLDSELVSQLWCQQVRANGISWLGFNESTMALLARWRWLNSHQSSVDFPSVTEQDLLAELEQWLSPFVGNIVKKAELLQLNFAELLLTLLSYQQQQQLAQLAPEFYLSPTGRKHKIQYSEELSPTIALPMQELYGEQQHPSIGGNYGSGSTIPLTLHLLSPAKRPIQVTQDLLSFWQGSYKEVQKDMKGRYPKHFWPDDPANAPATNKTKRHLSAT
ncbi:ATP-dependent helicase HrpB [Endozoicomonas sp. G2_1]|uniref:ATP-dependent helicase HrpB n=1 Tax=Endozoicomonas sp. G2_1 TaxID=2821091 RepID=UPI001AD9C90D|nr:ATP-dependent helicase HrpB [Endozoicomonas sp. G2_1]MBO9491195.1 ATP-dependent helicase HrpB [Endozoicomonas sp. G2_1]